jgi:hypothetical protein
MRVWCSQCDSSYDDAERLTFCPHEPIMDEDDLAQKKAALALLGKELFFAHQPEGPFHRIQSINWNGMITLDGMPGEFAPHLFGARLP